MHFQINLFVKMYVCIHVIITADTTSFPFEECYLNYTEYTCIVYRKGHYNALGTSVRFENVIYNRYSREKNIWRFPRRLIKSLNISDFMNIEFDKKWCFIVVINYYPTCNSVLHFYLFCFFFLNYSWSYRLSSFSY